MRLYIVQKFFDNEYLEDYIIFYDNDMMLQYLREVNQSSFFTYRGIDVEPLFEDIGKTFFDPHKSISELFDEFRKNIKPEYQFLAQELFYRSCPFVIKNKIFI
ncbi:hypothetical protein [Enterococcus faecium]|uniref:hypothetical protein n=1 Tax=Enterococcus TaxID=1350 RepID=UPI001913EAD4|nr:hypothetical protein [Enterococcus faecium]MBK5028537.1 hypothetical protein [Enterococcus faecium]MBK5039240.1 hypothetical protein [Enterococcus faecium]MBK5044181.1 hypothetical protein [Enterococcus faecium]MBK5069104.1 hypothetical protein [Enterococcus faecium]MBK5139715.1 hypothetical protein [Enterococcus faecium]